jgi:hypothetical protein
MSTNTSDDQRQKEEYLRTLDKAHQDITNDHTMLDSEKERLLNEIDKDRGYSRDQLKK